MTGYGRKSRFREIPVGRPSIHRAPCLLFILFISSPRRSAFWQSKRLVLRWWMVIAPSKSIYFSDGNSNAQNCECGRRLTRTKRINSMQTCPTTFRICASYGLKDHQNVTRYIRHAHPWIGFDGKKWKPEYRGSGKFFTMHLVNALMRLQFKCRRRRRFGTFYFAAIAVPAIVVDCSTYNSRIIESHTKYRSLS